MPKSRIEAFSDGVIAIIITIMVLEISAPKGNNLTALLTLVPGLLSYLLSFLFVGTYWNNHHHLFHALKKVNGKILWMNLMLLFFLSLFPIATAWMDETHFSALPIRVYAILNMITTFCYWGLEKLIISSRDCDKLDQALADTRKEKATFIVEVAAIVFSFIPSLHLVALPCLALIIVLWVIPDLRISTMFD